MAAVKVTDSIYSVGILNPNMRVFDIVMSTDYGTTYNSYVRRKPAGCKLIPVAAGVRAAVTKLLAVIFGQKAHGKQLAAVEQLACETLRAQENIGDGLVPEDSDAAPTGGHRVDHIAALRRDHSPLLANGLKGVERQLIRGKLLHNLASFRQLGRRAGRPRALFWYVDYIIAHPGKKKN